MKKFTKTVAALMAGLMVLSMTGCGGAKTGGEIETAPQSEGGSEAAAEEVKTAVEGKLIWATNAEFPPYEYHDGDRVAGIDAEIADYIGEQLGLEVQCEDMAFDSIIAAVTSGKADLGIAGMTVTEDRLENVNFSEPYVNAGQVIIVKTDSPIASKADLAGKTVGVQLGTTGDTYVSENDENITVERYSKGFEAVQALTQGKVDAVVIDGEPAKAFVASAGEDALKILDEPMTEEEYAIAISKDNEALLAKVNEVLSEMQENGKMAEITGKYLGDNAVDAESAEEETEAADAEAETEAAQEEAETTTAA